MATYSSTDIRDAALPSSARMGTMGASITLERPVPRVRIHITEGQRRALIAVLDCSPEPGVRVSAHTVSFDLADPASWLEARMAEWPRAEFPRASLHGVLRKLRSAIQGQVQPDLSSSASGQAEPDLETLGSDEAKPRTGQATISRLEPCRYCTCCPDGCTGADCPCTAIDGEEAKS
jgi:hypothetical protein